LLSLSLLLLVLLLARRLVLWTLAMVLWLCSTYRIDVVKGTEEVSVRSFGRNIIPEQCSQSEAGE